MRGNLPIHPSVLSLLQARTRLEEDHYPTVGVVRRVILVNVPAAGAGLWGIASYFVDEGTRNTFTLLSSDFLPTLQRFVTLDQLPAFLGGTLVDAHGDGECKGIVTPGGPVPLPFLAGVATDGHGDGQTLTLAAGGGTELHLSVPSGATVSWRWGTAHKDVVFRVDAVPHTAAATAATAATAPVWNVPVADVCVPPPGVHRCYDVHALTTVKAIPVASTVCIITS
jgi:hypothetical protein